MRAAEPTRPSTRQSEGDTRGSHCADPRLPADPGSGASGSDGRCARRHARAVRPLLRCRCRRRCAVQRVGARGAALTVRMWRRSVVLVQQDLRGGLGDGGGEGVPAGQALHPRRRARPARPRFLSPRNLLHARSAFWLPKFTFCADLLPQACADCFIPQAEAKSDHLCSVQMSHVQTAVAMQQVIVLNGTLHSVGSVATIQCGRC